MLPCRWSSRTEHAQGHLSESSDEIAATLHRQFAHTRILAGLYGVLLLDSGSHEPHAGTGKMFDWDSTEKLIRLISVTARVIFAGVLTPQNVGQAITRFRPWGVDVVSGVEAGPGRKDPEKVRAFIAAVRAAEALGTAGGR